MGKSCGILRYLASTTTDPSDVAGEADAVQALNIIVARTPNFEPQVFRSGQNKLYRYPRDEHDHLRYFPDGNPWWKSLMEIASSELPA